jgi:hypothetical protein
MAKFCGKCGSPLNDTAIFCGSCGAKIPAAAPAQPVYTAPPAPTPDPAAWAPVPASYSPPAPTPDPATWAPVPASYSPPTPTPDPATWAPVPASYSPPAPTPDPATWAPVPTSYPSPSTAPDPTAFAPVSTTYPPPPPTYTPAPTAYAPANFPAPAAKKSNTLLKVVIAVVVLICVGSALALAGLYYAAQKITRKAHAVTAQVLGGAAPSTPGGLGGLLSSSSSSDESAGGFKGDPCRFLSKAEVSQAVGLTVIRTEAKDGGCSYIAKGDPADMTAKHLSSMIGGLGADPKTQQMAQKFAGALFSQQQATDKSLAAQAATGEIPVLGLSFTAGNAAMEMKMNRGAFEHIKGGSPFGAGQGSAAQTATGDLTGIGDEAYVAGGGMMLVRKGNTVAHFMYISCPCNTDNIKPLAQMVASRL